MFKLFFLMPLFDKALCLVLYMHYIFQSPEQPLDVVLFVNKSADESEILSNLPRVMLENGGDP